MLVSFPQKPHKSIGALGCSFLTLASTAAFIAVTPASAGDNLNRVASLQPAEVVKAGINQSFPSVAGASDGARPDISALRFYATRGEQERVRAEIQRLKQLYPGWEQPANIFSDESPEEKKLWNLFAKGDLKNLKNEIENLAASAPGFTPSNELLLKLDEREMRDQIAHSWSKKEWQKTIDLVNENPALLMGDDVELIWFVAESYAHLERPADALEAFSAAFASSKTRQERKATMQKAASLLSTQAALTLLDNAKELSADAILKDEVEDAIVRGALARSAELGEQPPAILESKIAAFAARARTSGFEQDAMLLAWSHFGRSEWAQSEEWFKIAASISNNAKAVEGAIMSLKRLKKLGEAEDISQAHQNASAEIGKLYLGLAASKLLQTKPRALPGGFLQSYAAKAISLESGEGAEALGWYAYNVRQLEAAQAWFYKAMQWEETETAVYGQALTAVQMKDKQAFKELKEDYSAKYPRIASLKYTTAPKRGKSVVVKRSSSKSARAGKLRLKIAGLYKAKQYGACLRNSRALRKYGPLKAGDQQMRGWCLLGAKRPTEAERAFASAVRLGGKGKVASAYGQSLAALRSGKTNVALETANSNALTKRQRKTIDIELLTQRARAAFDNRDYASSVFALNKRRRLTAETRDLTMMRAWAHYHAGQHGAAGEIFAVLDQQLSTSETKRGLSAARLKHNSLIDPNGG